MGWRAVVLAFVGGCFANADGPFDAGVSGNRNANANASANAGTSSHANARAQRVVSEAPRVVDVLTAPGVVRDAVALDDALWLATSGGLLRTSLDLVEEARFTTLDGLPSNELWAVAAFGDELVIATSVGVVRARVDGGRLVDLRVTTRADGLPSAHARALAVVEGAIYVGSWGGGVARWDHGRWEPLPLGAPQANVTRLRADGNKLWVATASGGLARFERARTRWFTRSDGLPDDLVWDVLPSKGGVLVATGAGLARLDGERITLLDDRGERRALSARPSVVVAHPRAHALVDLGERTLVCGEEGARLVDADGGTVAALQPLGLPSPDVTALAVGEEALYVGTFDHGVARVRWDREQGTLEVAPVPDLIDARINALAVRTDGAVEELWVGTARGATRVRAGQATHFTTADGLPDDHVNAILAESDAVRLATTRGFAEIGPAGVARITPEHGLPTTRLTSLARAADGALWVGGAQGAAAWTGTRWTTARALRGELPDDVVTAVAAVGEELWVGTYASGLARHRDGRWTILREPEVPSSWVNPGALVPFADRVWVGTVERGLMVSPRLRPGEDEGRWRALTAADGLPSDDVTALAEDDGALWVGTRGGIARVALTSIVGGLR
jgi:ligand-binding sensor domain-containing protein